MEGERRCATSKEQEEEKRKAACGKKKESLAAAQSADVLSLNSCISLRAAGKVAFPME